MLLTREEANAKLAKSSGSEYEIVSLFLQPGETDGVNLCPFSTPECLAVCLHTAGLAAVFPSIIESRQRKAREFVANRRAFIERVRHELRLAQRRADKHGKTLAVRLNGSQEIKWPKSIYQEFPRAQFYDYAKNPDSHTEGNHHITFSFSGENLGECLNRLEHGENVAVVFDSPNFPTTWNGFPVIDGDRSDLRFLDPPGVVVGLKAKGEAKTAPTGGFIQITKKKGV